MTREIARRLIDGVWTTLDVDESGGGGSQPVTVLVQVNPEIDLHDATSHPLLWGTLKDNPWDFNTILALPAGLGLTLAFDGTLADITTTEAGTWAFSLALFVPADATWTGRLELDGNTGLEVAGAAADARLSVSEVVTYPSGATFVPTAYTIAEATADPYNASANLTIVRLA